MRSFISVIVLVSILSTILLILLVISTIWRWFTFLKFTRRLFPPDFKILNISVIILLYSSDLSFSS